MRKASILVVLSVGWLFVVALTPNERSNPKRSLTSLPRQSGSASSYTPTSSNVPAQYGHLPTGVRGQRFVANSIDEAAGYFRSHSRISDKALLKAMARAQAKGWKPTTFLYTASGPRIIRNGKIHGSVTRVALGQDLVLDDPSFTIWEWDDSDPATLDEMVYMQMAEPYDRASILVQMGGDTYNDLYVTWSELESYQEDEVYWSEMQGQVPPGAATFRGFRIRPNGPTVRLCSAPGMRGCCIPYWEWQAAYIQAAMATALSGLPEATKNAIKSGVIQGGLGAALLREIKLKSFGVGILTNILSAWIEYDAPPFDGWAWTWDYVRSRGCYDRFVISMYCLP